MTRTKGYDFKCLVCGKASRSRFRSALICAPCATEELSKAKPTGEASQPDPPSPVVRVAGERLVCREDVLGEIEGVMGIRSNQAALVALDLVHARVSRLPVSPLDPEERADADN